MNAFITLKSLFKIKQDSYHVLFYASHNVDEIWTRSTALECKKNGLSVIVACGNEILDDIKSIYTLKGIDLRQNCFGKDLKSIKTNIVVSASSGLGKSIFNRNIVAFAHMPHSISSLHMIYPEDAFDGYDYLLSVGPHHDLEMKAIAARRKLSRFKGTLPTGYGKMDIFKEQKGIKPHKVNTATILIAPSWGQKNILNTMGVELCLRLLEKNYNVVVRPHPMFFIENDPFLEEAEKKLSHIPNFTLEKSTTIGKSLFDADILITDYSGIAQEFASIHPRPVVFVDVAKKILNPSWAEYGITPIELRSRGVLGPICLPDCKDVLTAIETTLEDADTWKEKSLDFQKEYLHSGNCSVTALKHIHDFLSRGH